MIYTITLNPALDRTLWVEKIRDDVSNRIDKEYSYAGGKSIDVSKVLTNLGADNCALGFIGGFAGEELEGMLINDGIQCDFISVSGETRTNIIIHEATTGRQMAFNAKGPHIRPHEIMQLIHKIEGLDLPEVVTIGGSLPPGVSPEIYRKIIRMSRASGARVVLDVDGMALKVGILGRPDVIKPNIHELSEIAGRTLSSTEEVVAAAREINRNGVETVLVSLGARGILLVRENEIYHAVPPEVKVENTIGAGDSSVAGFVYGMIQEKDAKTSLTYAAAAGTATTLRAGTALCQKDDFLEILPNVKLTAL